MVEELNFEKLESRFHDFLNEFKNESKPVIAAWGLVKAGKSSLLNMISGHIDEEFFETGAIRTTRCNQQFEGDHFILTDTPGLGIDQEDNRHAYKGLDDADVILFVHAPPGELDREEIDLIKEIKEAFGERVEQRLVLVLTQLDKSQDESVQLVKQRIMEQMQMTFGIQPKCFLVSNSRFRKGVSHEKNLMITSSGIPQLSTHLDILAKSIGSELQSIRTNRRAARKAALLTELVEIIEDLQQQAHRVKSPYMNKVRSFNQIMGELRKNFFARTAEIAAIQNDLKNI